MRDLINWHILPIVVLRYCIEHEQRHTLYGEVVYDPRDFSYWGA